MPASSKPNLPIWGLSAASAARWPTTGPTAAPTGFLAFSAGAAAVAAETANRLPASSKMGLRIMAGVLRFKCLDSGLAPDAARARACPEMGVTKPGKWKNIRFELEDGEGWRRPMASPLQPVAREGAALKCDTMRPLVLSVVEARFRSQAPERRSASLRTNGAWI